MFSNILQEGEFMENQQTVGIFHWQVGSVQNILIFLVIITVIVGGLFFLYSVYVKYRNNQIHDHQLFLFKLKKIGLSSFQIKLLNNLIEILRLTNKLDIFTNPVLIETAIKKFIQYLHNQHEPEDSIASIAKEITIIYDKLFFPSIFKKPLDSLLDLELNQILYFSSPDKKIFLSKLIGKTVREFEIDILNDEFSFAINDLLNVFIWRIGDAEYVFETNITGIEKNIVTITIPPEFSRGKEVRHPYIEILTPSILKEADSKDDKKIAATLYKINDYEAVIRVNEKLNYNKSYNLEFEIDDFKFEILVRILSNKIIEEGATKYYTLKFEQMSEPARAILKRFMYDHL